MAQDRLEQLKQKYGPVFRVIEQQQIRLKNVHIEGEKLLIRGEAPSQDAKNKVWDQIKLVDPSYSDLTADITVSEQPVPAQQTMAAGAESQPAAPSQTVYTVKPGDTLSKIAEKFYGNAGSYRKIFEANRDQLDNPDRIRPGQNLRIPGKNE